VSHGYSRGNLILIALGVAATCVCAGAALHGGGSTGVWLLGGCALALLLVPRLAAARRERAMDTVEFDALSIRRLRGGREIESIRWDELAEIDILTTNEGPWSDDLYWVLDDARHSKGCIIVQGAKGLGELLARLQRLPRFDNDQVIRAMASTDNARFPVWRKAGPGGEAP
jgi:hypothetical protein